MCVSSILSCSTGGETDEDRISLQAMRGEKPNSDMGILFCTGPYLDKTT